MHKKIGSRFSLQKLYLFIYLYLKVQFANCHRLLAHKIPKRVSNTDDTDAIKLESYLLKPMAICKIELSGINK